jgi:hypothetical protein
MTGSLSIDIFNSGYKPIPGGPGWDDSAPVIWPARTSTLISGQRDALVDALLATSEGERLAVWVRKRLLAAAVMTAAAAWGGEADG